MILTKKILPSFGLALLLALPLGANAVTGVQELQRNTQQFGAATGLGTGARDEDLKTKIANIINIVLGFLGIIAVVMIVYSGFRWMMAGGNEDTVREAKGTLKNALIGLVIVFLAYGITAFTVRALSRAAADGGGGVRQIEEPAGAPGG